MHTIGAQCDVARRDFQIRYHEETVVFVADKDGERVFEIRVWDAVVDPFTAVLADGDDRAFTAAVCLCEQYCVSRKLRFRHDNGQLQQARRLLAAAHVEALMS